ncbi:MAG TPA: riboflavin synthase [Burkholderiales bacterium]|nr:riboflavin synthase [Burkholderiales bacterium]
MFTGIVQAVGGIVRTDPFEVETGALDLSATRVGDSICVQGACLTVTRLTGRGFLADVSAETLRVTAGLDAPGTVNLEPALRAGDALGGHLVTGHVDGVGELVRREGSVFVFRVPAQLARYVARKGSICVDGVSLTVNRVQGGEFEVNLIPHTLSATTLARLEPGTRVNLEVDLVARYLERLLEAR